MFEAAAQKLEKGLEQITQVNLEHASAGDKLRLGAELAFGAAAFAVAKRFHLPEKIVTEAVAKVTEVAGTSKSLSTVEWLAQMPKSEVASILSPHLSHADSLAKRLAVAFRQDGDITSNLERALNEHSAEFFPYVKPLTVKTVAEDDDSFAHAEKGSILIHGTLERNATGEVVLPSQTVQGGGESGLAAAVGHEYTHVEQRDFLDFARGNDQLTEGQYQRGKRIATSLGNNNQTVLRALETENEMYSLRAVHFAGKKGMVEANAISPANFAPYYQKIVDLSADEIPPSFKAFVDKQNALRQSLFPLPTDHDMGRQFFVVLRGQIASASSRAVMSRGLYENLYHEREAFQFEDAIKPLYLQVSDQSAKF
jgi:hypothetical protein